MHTRGVQSCKSHVKTGCHEAGVMHANRCCCGEGGSGVNHRGAGRYEPCQMYSIAIQTQYMYCTFEPVPAPCASRRPHRRGSSRIAARRKDRPCPSGPSWPAPMPAAAARSPAGVRPRPRSPWGPACRAPPGAPSARGAGSESVSRLGSPRPPWRQPPPSPPPPPVAAAAAPPPPLPRPHPSLHSNLRNTAEKRAEKRA